MKIAVVGCGIGGMANAIQLARSGHHVTVFESFPEARPLGAGLLLQPTGLGALAALELCQEIKERGAEIDALVGRRPDGKLIMDLRYAYARREDIGIGIHRATLFDALHKAMLVEGVDLLTDSAVQSIETPDNPIIHLENGNTEGSFDCVIVSDGAHSKLRNIVSPIATAPQYPWGAVWTILPDASGIWHNKRLLAQVYSGTQIMIGVLPAGENPHDPDGPDCVSFFWSLETNSVENWRSAGLAAFKEEVMQFWPEASELISNVQTLDAFLPASYRDVRCPNWSKGKIILIGDAAHGASPQLGQGANMALCDAVALASCLQEFAPTKAFLNYEKERRPTLRYYTWMSWALTPIFQGHAMWVGGIRDAVFGMICRLPGLRNIMAWTLVGRGRWFW